MSAVISPSENCSERRTASALPVRRSELVVRCTGPGGESVVKDPRTGEYYELGPEEAFLLAQLDGASTAEGICRAYERRFGTALSEAELEEFVALARSLDFLTTLTIAPVHQPAAEPQVIEPPGPDIGRFAWSALVHAPAGNGLCGSLEGLTFAPPPEPVVLAWHNLDPGSGVRAFVATNRRIDYYTPAPILPTLPDEPPPAAGRAEPAPAPKPAQRPRQSILYWRKSVFDPDRLFNAMEPWLRWVWTTTFVVLSGGLILLACGVAWSNRVELVSHFAGALHWQTLALAWVALVLVTTCHEFAHGLTCKHYGGEVHEVGFLAMYFIPCFYCNVSDAWLFRDKSRRLWVTFAGAYCDLVLWALAVFVWRLTVQDGVVNYLAWVVLSVCGVRVFFNFNPLLKLDGYYLLSDALGVSNLRQRAWDAAAGRLRWLLWGAPAPRPEPAGRWLAGFGFLTWAYGAAFLTLMLWGLIHFGYTRWGWVGVAVFGWLIVPSARGTLAGISRGEVTNMLRTRWARTAMWVIGLGGLVAAACAVPIEQRASGTFRVRPRTRVEVRAPVAGFLREVHFDEGQVVGRGALVARMEIPDLSSRIVQKEAEIGEGEAKLRLLKAGPRREEVIQERRRVQRARGWRDLAEQDQGRAKKALAEEMIKLQEQVRQAEIESEYAARHLERARGLLKESVLSDVEFQDAERREKVAGKVLSQQQAQLRARRELGTLEAEAERARREKDLADAEATLKLLEEGTRPEEIEAQESHLRRLREELGYLRSLEKRLPVCGGSGGTMVTPRLREKVGQYFKEGELICVIEDASSLEAEITLGERELPRVESGQVVELKTPALPYTLLKSRVDRIAPAAVAGEGPGAVQSTVSVYCAITGAPDQLKPGMSGHARIVCGRRPIAKVLGERVMRTVRTEFWW